MNRIQSSLAALVVPAAEDIRDIRAPIALPPWWRWPLAIALAALAALIVVLLVRAWQRRKARRATPLERARLALDVAEEHARAGRFRAWADVVADTLRSALATRVGDDVLPRTTKELAAQTWGDELVPDAPRLLDLLAACDLTRFARASLDAATLVAQTDVARELVERLFAPPPQPAAPSTSRSPEPVTS